jgi:hypothetical protein
MMFGYGNGGYPSGKDDYLARLRRPGDRSAACRR